MDKLLEPVEPRGISLQNRVLRDSLTSPRSSSVLAAKRSRSEWGMSEPKTICPSPTRSMTWGSIPSSTSALQYRLPRLRYSFGSAAALTVICG